MADRRLRYPAVRQPRRQREAHRPAAAAALGPEAADRRREAGLRAPDARHVRRVIPELSR